MIVEKVNGIKMKITYISQITIPSRSADSVQVVRACDALNELGYLSILKIPYRKKHEKNIDSIHDFYSCQTKFSIIHEKFFGLPERLRVILIALKSVFDESDLIISRSVPAALVCVIFGKRVFLEIHEPLNKSRMLTVLSKLIMKSKNFKGLITNCSALEDVTVRDFPVTKDKIIAIQNGADALGQVEPISLQKKGMAQIGYCGQLYKGKGVEIIYEIAPLFPECVFHIVGGLKEDIEYWKRQLENIQNVIFHGFVEPQLVPNYLQAFDILLAPYQYVVHGFNATNNLSQWTSPMKVFDYMSVGKPIIASDLPFMTEILEHEVDALLCPPEDIHLWKESLSLLLNNTEYAARLGNAAKVKFTKEYTWPKRTENLMNFIRSKI